MTKINILNIIKLGEIMKKVNKYLIVTMTLLLFPKVVLAAKKFSCGEVGKGGIADIPYKIPELTSFFISFAQVAATVILVILGAIDLFKGITAQKEEEIKKGQQSFVKRLIAAALVFFVVMIVKLLVGVIANDNTAFNVVSCMDCFIN